MHIEEFADEIVQDVFLKYWYKIEEYEPEKGRLFTWMLNIARNASIDKLRSKEYRSIRKSETTDRLVYQADEHYAESSNPDQIGLKETLDKLSAEQKQIIELMYFKGYTQSEIAEEYNIPLGTVKTRAKSAIQKLRNLFV